MFKEDIINLLVSNLHLKEEEISHLIEIPPTSDLGDYAFPCFVLSKKEKKAPVEIAVKLAEELGKKLPRTFEKAEAKGPYINFFISKKELAKNIIKINANFGKTNLGKKRKVVIDFSQPNIGKPMHVGHIRSTILGDSLMRIYETLGYYSVGINYLGDVGLHIGKLIVAYELWLNKEALKKDPVTELLRLYVKFCAEEKTQVTEGTEEEFQDNEWTNKAKEKIRLLELGDKKAEKIWKEIYHSSVKGFDRVYDLLKVEFTETTGQSQFSKKGKEIVLQALEKGVAKREPDGAVYVEMVKEGSKEPIKKYILRSNQTASYITQDLGAAVERYKKYKFDKMIYVVDSRQKDHFISLFTILRILGNDFVDKMHHLPFGTIRFGNEVLATREGKIILLEDVLKKTIEKAKEEIEKRKTKGDAEKVGVGAVKYIVLKTDPVNDINFSWEQALSFEGNTGPYLQYSYARASSIIRKAGNFNKSVAKIGSINKQEFELLKKISDFPEIVQRAGAVMNPSLIANYAFELAQIFNEFYHECLVIGSKEEAFRLCLVNAFRTCLKNALCLLGIEVMEEM
jgi:arginyl-tRNA synthetase